MSESTTKRARVATPELAKPPSKRYEGGKVQKLESNFWPLKLGSDKLHSYSVLITPQEPLPTRVKVSLVNSHRKVFQKDESQLYVFDGTTLIANHPNIVKEGEELLLKSVFNDKEFQLSIKYVKELTGQEKIDQSTLQVFNVVYRKALYLMGLKLLGRNYFDPTSSNHRHVKSIRAEIWPGYEGSILLTERGCFLNIDLKQKIIRQDRAIDMISDIFSRSGNKLKAEQAISDRVVLTRYNNKTYRISGIDWKSSPKTEFEMKDGKKQTFSDYYEQVYGCKIKDLNQPLLISKVRFRGQKKQEIRLIPELCLMTGVTSQELGKVRRDLTLSPGQRFDALQNFIDRISKQNDVKKLFNGWNINIGTEAAKATSNVMDMESITFGRGEQVKAERGQWQQSLKKVSVLTPCNLQNWIIVSTKNNTREADKLVGDLKRVAQGLGVRIENPADHLRCADDQDGYEMTKAISQYYHEKGNSLQFIVVILPYGNPTRYNQVKKCLTTACPVPSQCVVSNTLNKGLSVATNICLQIQTKLGARIWQAKIPFPKPVMIVGIDVTHSQRRQGDSVGAVCATVNKDYTQYVTKIFFKKSGQEINDSLRNFFIAAVEKFEKINGHKPAGIIIYRDGVSDGEIQSVLKNELKDVKAGFSKINYDPPICYIVVNKRINQKFFRPQGNNLVNPEIGTLIDAGLTKNDAWEFYLNSTAANQGTVNPVRYQVIHNTTKLNSKVIAQLTHKLTHMYFNWSGTIRIPAPVMYAHKAVYFVGHSIKQDPSVQLENNLYFI